MGGGGAQRRATSWNSSFSRGWGLKKFFFKESSEALLSLNTMTANIIWSKAYFGLLRGKNKTTKPCPMWTTPWSNLNRVANPIQSLSGCNQNCCHGNFRFYQGALQPPGFQTSSIFHRGPGREVVLMTLLESPATFAHVTLPPVHKWHFSFAHTHTHTPTSNHSPSLSCHPDLKPEAQNDRSVQTKPITGLPLPKQP